MAIKKIKVSELPLVQALTGLYTIGVDALNRSVKVSLEFIKTTTDSANNAATNANTAAAAANTAATNANTAAANANQAAEVANQATTNVEAAIEATNTAAAAANTAATNANTAATAANEAAAAAAGPHEFTEAPELANIVSGETTSTIFGKLKKWFSSFGTLAWKSTVDYDEDIINKPDIPATQIQADYTQSDTAAKDYIKNKPNFKTVFSQAITGTGNINPKLISGISYDGSTGDITISFIDGSDNEVINIPVDNFLSEADYDSDTHILTLTMQNDEEVNIDLSDLIHEYEAAADGGLEIVNGNQFKIKNEILNDITKVPIQKEIELLVSNWTGSGDLFSYEVGDDDVVEGCLFESWPADRASKQTALYAEIDENIIVADDLFTITCAKKPSANFNIIYTMLV
jgi:hypothetical protein